MRKRDDTLRNMNRTVAYQMSHANGNLLKQAGIHCHRGIGRSMLKTAAYRDRNYSALKPRPFPMAGMVHTALKDK